MRGRVVTIDHLAHIVALRKTKGLSSDNIAERVGLSGSTVNRRWNQIEQRTREATGNYHEPLQLSDLLDHLTDPRGPNQTVQPERDLSLSDNVRAHIVVLRHSGNLSWPRIVERVGGVDNTTADTIYRQVEQRTREATGNIQGTLQLSDLLDHLADPRPAWDAGQARNSGRTGEPVQSNFPFTDPTLEGLGAQRPLEPPITQTAPGRTGQRGQIREQVHSTNFPIDSALDELRAQRPLPLEPPITEPAPGRTVQMGQIREQVYSTNSPINYRLLGPGLQPPFGPHITENALGRTGQRGQIREPVYSTNSPINYSPVGPGAQPPFGPLFSHPVSQISETVQPTLPPIYPATERDRRPLRPEPSIIGPVPGQTGEPVHPRLDPSNSLLNPSGSRSEELRAQFRSDPSCVDSVTGRAEESGPPPKRRRQE